MGRLYLKLVCLLWCLSLTRLVALVALGLLALRFFVTLDLIWESIVSKACLLQTRCCQFCCGHLQIVAQKNAHHYETLACDTADFAAQFSPLTPENEEVAIYNNNTYDRHGCDFMSTQRPIPWQILQTIWFSPRSNHIRLFESAEDLTKHNFRTSWVYPFQSRLEISRPINQHCCGAVSCLTLHPVKLIASSTTYIDLIHIIVCLNPLENPMLRWCLTD